MKSTRFIVSSVPYGLGRFLFLSFVVFSTFSIFAVIVEANPKPSPSIEHGHLPKIKIPLPRLFKLTKPHYRKINLGKLSKPLKRFRDDGKKFRENYQETLRNSYPILQGKISHRCSRYLVVFSKIIQKLKKKDFWDSKT